MNRGVWLGVLAGLVVLGGGWLFLSSGLFGERPLAGAVTGALAGSSVGADSRQDASGARSAVPSLTSPVAGEGGSTAGSGRMANGMPLPPPGGPQVGDVAINPSARGLAVPAGGAVGSGPDVTGARSAIPGLASPVTDEGGAAVDSGRVANGIPLPPQGGPEVEGVGANPSPAGAGATGNISPGRVGAPTMEAIQAELSNLTANGRQPTPAEVDQVLAKMQANQGTSVVNGVDLSVLRSNLQAADRMLTISNQAQALAQNPTPENSQKLQVLMSELQRLQASMNTHVLRSKP